MIAEVIAIGDELTTGQRLDTNSQWLSQRLGELGFVVRYHSTAADDLASCSEVFSQAFTRAQVIVATGGLGPTADDLTREAIAAATGRPLEHNAQVEQQIRDLFERRGRTMPDRNTAQAMFPRGSCPIPNPHGTAPGIALRLSHAGATRHLFALPGVPAEMFEMWAGTLSAELTSLEGAGQTVCHYRIKCFGVGESQLEAMIPELTRRNREPAVGITVHQGTITLRITARGSSRAVCQQAMQATIDEAQRRLGPLVFGQEDDELQDVVAGMLADEQQTLATVEWGTAGLLARWFAGVEAARPFYSTGLVVHSAEAAAGLLGLADVGRQPTSEAFAASAAQAVRERSAADLALAVGAFCAADSALQPGRCYVAIASSDGVTTQQVALGAHPAILSPLTAKRALNLLRLRLLGDEAIA